MEFDVAYEAFMKEHVDKGWLIADSAGTGQRITAYKVTSEGIARYLN